MDEIDHQKVKFKSIKKVILKCFQMIELIGRKIDDQLFKLPKTELLCAGMIVVAKKTAFDEQIVGGFVAIILLVCR